MVVVDDAANFEVVGFFFLVNQNMGSRMVESVGSNKKGTLLRTGNDGRDFLIKIIDMRVVDYYANLEKTKEELILTRDDNTIWY